MLAILGRHIGCSIMLSCSQYIPDHESASIGDGLEDRLDEVHIVMLLCINTRSGGGTETTIKFPGIEREGGDPIMSTQRKGRMECSQDMGWGWEGHRQRQCCHSQNLV